MNNAKVTCIKLLCFGFQAAWRQFGIFYKKKYDEDFPPCIKSLLELAGYDTLSSLANIDEKKVKCVEEHLDADKTPIQKLECCCSSEYKQLEKFQFLPGHKTIIISIPDELKEMNEIKRSKKMANMVTKHSLSDEELKENLIKTLATAWTTALKEAEIELPQNIITSENNLYDFKRFPEGESKIHGKICECLFSCPFCSKTFKMTYKAWWWSSKATKHLKQHASGHEEQDKD